MKYTKNLTYCTFQDVFHKNTTIRLDFLSLGLNQKTYNNICQLIDYLFQSCLS